MERRNFLEKVTINDLNKNIVIKYICDVDDTRGGRVISELGKKQGFEPVSVRDMRKVFDDKEVDGVIIATPQHWHGLASIWAMQAGKDVYVEKCVSFTIEEGQKMIEAAMKYERILQYGTQNRSAEYNFKARNYIRSGTLGEIVAVDVMELDEGPVPFNEKEESSAPDTINWDLWLGPAPKVPYSISRNKSLSYRSGKKQLLFSPEKEVITNDDKAQNLAEGYHRNGFELTSNI